MISFRRRYLILHWNEKEKWKVRHFFFGGGEGNILDQREKEPSHILQKYAENYAPKPFLRNFGAAEKIKNID